MRVLFLSPYVPARVRVRPYNWIRALAELGHDVHLIALDPPEDAPADRAEMRRVCAAVDVFPLSRGRTLANAIRALPRRDTPLQLAYSHHPSAERLVASVASTDRYDVVHVEHLRGVALASGVQRLPVVFDAVDSISALFAQTAKLAPSRGSRLLARIDLPRSRRFEAGAPLRFSRTVVTSEREADAFVDLGGAGIRGRMAVIPNGVDTEYFRPAERRDQRAVLFTGKLSYHANAAAALRLVERIMPLVWARRPETRVILAGKGPSARVRALGQDSRVTVTGYVEDMRPFFADAGVAVCPLVYGVGIQNKALEALASGVATIVTPAVARALQGAPGEHYLTAEDDQEMAERIGEVLSRPGLRRRLEGAGREYVTAHHRWTTLATSLLETYQAAADAPRVPVENRSASQRSQV